MTGTQLAEPPGEDGMALQRSPTILTQVELLKEMLWCYVINDPAIAGHQHGQRLVIRTLFAVLNDAAIRKEYFLFPAAFRERAEQLAVNNGNVIPTVQRARLVADAIASLTDQQALRMHQRFTATTPGAALDPIVV